MHPIDFKDIKPGDLMFFPVMLPCISAISGIFILRQATTATGLSSTALDPDAEDYRADLPEKLESVGSIF
jgi:hypothetical protein